MRQQVLAEAAADMEVHRQMMQPTGADVTAVTATTAVSSLAKIDAVRWGKSDGVGKVMETVAKLRLQSAMEELEARSVPPEIRRRLLAGLLNEVRHARAIIVVMYVPATHSHHVPSVHARAQGTYHNHQVPRVLLVSLFFRSAAQYFSFGFSCSFSRRCVIVITCVFIQPL